MMMPTAQSISSYFRVSVPPTCSFALPSNLVLAGDDHFLGSRDATFFIVRGGGAAAALRSSWPMTFFAARGRGGAGSGKEGRDGFSSEDRTHLLRARIKAASKSPGDVQRFKELVQRVNVSLSKLRDLFSPCAWTFEQRMTGIHIEWAKAEECEQSKKVLLLVEGFIRDIDAKISKAMESETKIKKGSEPELESKTGPSKIDQQALALLSKIRKMPGLIGRIRKEKIARRMAGELGRLWYRENMKELITIQKWIRYIAKPVSRQIVHVYLTEEYEGLDVIDELVNAVGRRIYAELQGLEKTGVKNSSSLAQGLITLSSEEIIALLEEHDGYVVARALYAADPLAQIKRLELNRDKAYEAAEKRLLQLIEKGELVTKDIKGIARVISSRCVFYGKRGNQDRESEPIDIVPRAILLADNYKKAYDTFLKGMSERDMMWAKEAILGLALSGIEHGNDIDDYVAKWLVLMERTRLAAEDELRKARIVDEGSILKASRIIAVGKRVYRVANREEIARTYARKAAAEGRMRDYKKGRKSVVLRRA